MNGDRPQHLREAPSRPGEPARWSSGSKTAGGTSRSDACLVWFTIGRGVVTEVYYPRVDMPCTRDLYFLVTGPDGFFSDEREDAEHRVEWLAEGVPGFVITTTCSDGRYRLEKTVITDDRLHVVLQKARFAALKGAAGDYRLHVYLNPHVAGHGSGNTGWVGESKGRTTLFAERGDVALALMCSAPFAAASAGFVGKSDGPDDLQKCGRLTKTYIRAAEGNVGLIAEVDLTDGTEFTLALGFGLGPGDAAHHALGGLRRDFARAQELYVARWREWQQSLLPLDEKGTGRHLYRVSTANLLAHTNKSVPGAVASLAIPWGDHRGDDDLMQGAYHLVWSRDLVQHGGALLAAGAHADARRLLEYLAATQEADGHWPQNMWVSGEPFWDGIQVDQAAQPVLLADLALREGAITSEEREHFWPMVRKATGYVVRNGASTEQDRWEEQTGYNAYTLATTVASLLAAADWADAAGEGELATYLRETADARNACVEGWLYVRETALARKVGIDGYYVRILPPEAVEPAAPGQGHVRLRDADAGDQDLPASEVISVDAPALVRFGLRAADDPRIVSTLKAIDAVLRLDLGRGPIWHRYNGDRFGEHDDGSPFETDNKGKGRAWPLLIGERAHCELAAGNPDRAEELLSAMANYACDTGMISEQVWDAPDVPEKGLFRGRPTGSAMPLLWAHSEYVKLCRSLKEGKVFDRPAQAAERYSAGGPKHAAHAVWRVDHPCAAIRAGTPLRIEATEGVEIEWEIVGNKGRALPVEKTFLGVRVTDIPAAVLLKGTVVLITAAFVGEDKRPRREEHSVAVE